MIRTEEMVKKVQRYKRKTEGVRFIELSWGKWAIVDAEDYEWLNSYKWCAVEQNRSWYAKTLRRDGMPMSMHRLILDAPKGLLVDHRDHNGLNNRKSNLRQCTRNQNRRNRRPNRGGTSKYKGVHRRKSGKKFRAVINHNKQRFHLGWFDDEVEAAVAYDIKAMELFGEFAYFNFPELMQRYRDTTAFGQEGNRQRCEADSEG